MSNISGGLRPRAAVVAAGRFHSVRVLGLTECGSHAVVDAALGTYKQAGQTLAESIVRSLRSGVLLLADRGFFSYRLWEVCAATGTDLLWRMKSNAVLPAETRYPDGSFASHVHLGTKARRNDTNGIAPSTRPRSRRAVDLPPGGPAEIIAAHCPSRSGSARSRYHSTTSRNVQPL